MAEQMASPYFPVDLDQMKAKRDFYDIENGCLPMGDGIQVKTAWLNHPQGCMGFRLETKEGVLVYATDNEPGDPNFDKAVRKLAEGADILIYDAQYLPEEYEARRRGWGHSHWREAVNVVMESGAKELILYHHDPDHDRCDASTKWCRKRATTIPRCAPRPKAWRSSCSSRQPERVGDSSLEGAICSRAARSRCLQGILETSRCHLGLDIRLTPVAMMPRFAKIWRLLALAASPM